MSLSVMLAVKRGLLKPELWLSLGGELEEKRSLSSVLGGILLLQRPLDKSWFSFSAFLSFNFCIRESMNKMIYACSSSSSEISFIFLTKLLENSESFYSCGRI